MVAVLFATFSGDLSRYTLSLKNVTEYADQLIWKTYEFRKALL